MHSFKLCPQSKIIISLLLFIFLVWDAPSSKTVVLLTNASFNHYMQRIRMPQNSVNNHWTINTIITIVRSIVLAEFAKHVSSENTSLRVTLVKVFKDTLKGFVLR